MLEGKVCITEHAVLRWRERLGFREDSQQDVARSVMRSLPADRAMRRRLARWYRSSGHSMHSHDVDVRIDEQDGAIFVAKWQCGKVMVMTVLSLGELLKFERRVKERRLR